MSSVDLMASVEKVGEMDQLDHVITNFAAYKPELGEVAAESRQAAVAIIVQVHRDEAHVLFIKRAEFEGDPWSGQMSFPGGHRDETDATLQSAAERETFEEIGLCLDQAEYCGQLSHQRTFGRGNRPGTLVAPFVYVNREPFRPQLSSEVDSIVWGSLDGMMSRNLFQVEERMLNNQPTKFNGYSLGTDRFVWGLTYRTLQEFFTVLHSDYVAPPESV